MVWDAPTPVAEAEPADEWRRRTGEILRRIVTSQSLEPDIIHISNLFEGLVDNAITSVGAFANGTATAVTLYDLIPLIYQDPYLVNPTVASLVSEKARKLSQGQSLALYFGSPRGGKGSIGSICQRTRLSICPRQPTRSSIRYNWTTRQKRKFADAMPFTSIRDVHGRYRSP